MLIGAEGPLRAHVETAVLAAGLRLAARGAGEGYAAEPGQRLLYAVDEPAPPPGALLVGLDGQESWSLAARHPGSSLVTLPSGAAWLGARLSGALGRGTVVALAHLGEGASSYRTGVALAEAAAQRGLRVVLADADPLSARRWVADGEGDVGDWDAGRRGRGGGLRRPGGGDDGAEPPAPGRRPGAGGWPEGRASQRPGWLAAHRWAADGSVSGLSALLPVVNGVARLGWGAAEDPAALGPPEQNAVLEALAASHDLVVFVAGAAAWPRPLLWPSASALLLTHAGHDPWPPHECAAGASVLLACARGGREPSADGPETARRLGATWVGSSADGAGPRPSRGQRRLARRVWLPLLLGAEAGG